MVQISTITEAPESTKVLQKKREILEAASRVFRRKGLHAAGMREIAAESGMHASNLYYYFQSKQELLAFCQKDSLDGLAEIAFSVEQFALHADTRLALLIIGHFVLLNESRPGSTAHLEVETVSEPWLEEIKLLRHAYETVFRRVIVEGQAQGVFRNADPIFVTLAILGALNWSVKWFRPQGEKSALQMGNEFAEYLVSGLLEPGTELHRPNSAQITQVTRLSGAQLPSSRGASEQTIKKGSRRLN
jgi:AcrR family transcriptional regulator